MSAEPTPITAPFCGPLSTHPDTPHVVLDCDGNVVAECGTPWMYSVSRAQRIQFQHEAEEMAAWIVAAVNEKLESDEARREYDAWALATQQGEAES